VDDSKPVAEPLEVSLIDVSFLFKRPPPNINMQDFADKLFAETDTIVSDLLENLGDDPETKEVTDEDSLDK
jgi:hypothetical protein